jgi:hypothetical protein
VIASQQPSYCVQLYLFCSILRAYIYRQGYGAVNMTSSYDSFLPLGKIMNSFLCTAQVMMRQRLFAEVDIF